MTRKVLRSLALAALLAMTGCRESEPLRIGYVGGITGHLADLGVAGRDGALLAVETINRTGGIRGRKIELVVRDDRNDPATAPKAVNDLIANNVVAIIGHMTSAMSLAGAPVANDAGIVMLSPTTSTNELSGKDDMFLRIYPASRETATRLALYTRNDLHVGRIAIVIDASNRGHTLGWYRNFSDAFGGAGGTVALVHEFESGKTMDLSRLVAETTAARADGIFILAGAVDTALICQNLRKGGIRLPIVVSEWSTTDELVPQGGKAVEGVMFYQHFDRANATPAYQTFRDAYEERFGRPPSFPAVFSYEAVTFVADALRRGADRKTLKADLLRQHTFPGLQGTVTLDRFGDATRDAFLMTVTDGVFVKRK